LDAENPALFALCILRCHAALVKQLKSIAQVIFTEYIGQAQQFSGPRFRRLVDEVYPQPGRDDSSFQCPDEIIADFERSDGSSSWRFHMRWRNRHCGSIDIELWIEQTQVVRAGGQMGTDEGQ
jgi:hypothetical protein